MREAEDDQRARGEEARKRDRDQTISGLPLLGPSASRSFVCSAVIGVKGAAEGEAAVVVVVAVLELEPEAVRPSSQEGAHPRAPPTSLTA